MLFGDDFNLHLDALNDFIRHDLIAVIESFCAKFFEQVAISFHTSGVRCGILRFRSITELKVHATTMKQGFRAFYDFRVFNKSFFPCLVGHKTFVLIRLIFLL